MLLDKISLLILKIDSPGSDELLANMTSSGLDPLHWKMDSFSSSRTQQSLVKKLLAIWKLSDCHGVKDRRIVLTFL